MFGVPINWLGIGNARVDLESIIRELELSLTFLSDDLFDVAQGFDWELPQNDRELLYIYQGIIKSVGSSVRRSSFQAIESSNVKWTWVNKAWARDDLTFYANEKSHFFKRLSTSLVYKEPSFTNRTQVQSLNLQSFGSSILEPKNLFTQSSPLFRSWPILKLSKSLSKCKVTMRNVRYQGDNLCY